MMKNFLIDLCSKRALLRCNIPNSGNGKSYMEALVIDKSRYCVLWR